MTERTIILDAITRIAIALFFAIILPATKGWIERNRDNKELQMVLQMADIAVKSVENDLKTAEGAAKKAEAMRRLAAQVASWGVKDFTVEELNHYVETAVKEMWENAIPGAMPVVVENTPDEPLPVEDVTA